MTNGTALQETSAGDINFYEGMETSDLAKHFAKSGFFEDDRDMSKAIVKVLAGQEIGLPPVASMRNIDLVKGELQVRGRAILARIRQSSKYEYEVIDHTREKCTLAFFDISGSERRKLGEYSWTIEEARNIVVYENKNEPDYMLADKDNWQSYPKKMLLWRCASDGVDTYCPDLLYGAYTADEISQKKDVMDVSAQVKERTDTTATEMAEDLDDKGSGNDSPEESSETDDKAETSSSETVERLDDKYLEGIKDLLEAVDVDRHDFVAWLDAHAMESDALQERGIDDIGSLVEIPNEYGKRIADNFERFQLEFLKWKKKKIDDDSKRVLIQSEIQKLKEQV